MEQKVKDMYICGFPFDEVVKILTIYKETGHANQDYQEGFRDGINKAFNGVDEMLRYYFKKLEVDVNGR